MPTPTTATAQTITATCNAIESNYEPKLELLHKYVASNAVAKDVLVQLLVDLGKLGASINALGAAPTAGEKTAALNMQTAVNRMARVIAGTDP